MREVLKQEHLPLSLLVVTPWLSAAAGQQDKQEQYPLGMVFLALGVGREEDSGPQTLDRREDLVAVGLEKVRRREVPGQQVKVLREGLGHLRVLRVAAVAAVLEEAVLREVPESEVTEVLGSSLPSLARQ